MKIYKAGTKMLIAHSLSLPRDNDNHNPFEKELLSFYELSKESRPTSTKWVAFYDFKGRCAAERYIKGELFVPAKIREKVKFFWKDIDLPIGPSLETIEEFNKLIS